MKLGDVWPGRIESATCPCKFARIPHQVHRLSRHQNKLRANLENNEVARVIPELSLSIKQNQVMGFLADVQPVLIGEVTKVLEWGREVSTWLLP